jgi:hypothetical protein
MRMNMIKFSVQAAHLNAAIDAVQTVVPRACNKERDTGFLFYIRNSTEGYMYSADANHVARARMDIFDADGEGVFAYPYESIGAFKYFSGPISFESKRDGDQFSVSYDPGRGAGGTRPAFDPKWLATFDKELKAAKETGKFPAAVLRKALSLSKDFHGENNPRAEDQHKTIQMFDKDAEVEDPKNKGQMIKPYEKGDGVLYAANGSQAFYFDCEAFKGKSFALKAEHLGLLLSFLGKIEGTAVIKSTDTKTFVCDESESRVFGWTHTTKLHAKHSYYGLGGDKFVFKIPKAEMIDALGYMGEELGDKHDKVRLLWNKDSNTLQLEAAEGNAKGIKSMFISVGKDSSLAEPDRTLEPFINRKQLLSLFKDAEGGTVELRVYPIDPSEKRPKGGAYLRTIDRFYLDAEGKTVAGELPEGGQVPAGAISCTVTRFMPSYE